MDGSEKRYGTSYRLQIRGLKLVFQKMHPRLKGLRQLATRKGQLPDSPANLASHRALLSRFLSASHMFSYGLELLATDL